MNERGIHRRGFLETSAAAGTGVALANLSRTARAASSEDNQVKKIHVGVITHGGGAHLGAYFDALDQAEEVQSVTLADSSGTSEGAARKALGERLTRVYQDPKAMLREEKPAMALVSMEAAIAPPWIEAALEAGCHVFAEKPACVRGDDFERLNRKAAQSQRYLMLALANRVHPAVQEARRLIREDMIGQIYGAQLHIVADQARLTRPSYHDSWYAQKARAGGGFLIWLGIHWLDLAMYLTEAKIVEVAGFSGNVGGQPIDIEDSAAVSMRFDNGTFGTLTAGYYLDRSYNEMIEIWGSHGWLSLDLIGETPLAWYSTKKETPKVELWSGVKGPSSYTPFVREAVRACAGLQDPPITGDECEHVLKTIFAFYKAAETGQSQRVG